MNDGGMSWASITLIVMVAVEVNTCCFPLYFPPPSWEDKVTFYNVYSNTFLSRLLSVDNYDKNSLRIKSLGEGHFILMDPIMYRHHMIFVYFSSSNICSTQVLLKYLNKDFKNVRDKNKMIRRLPPAESNQMSSLKWLLLTS